MKQFLPVFLLVFTTQLFAQTEFMVYAIGCPDGKAPIGYSFDGFTYQKILEPARQDGDKYYFQIPDNQSFVHFGISPNETKGVLMTEEKDAYLVSNCNRFSAARAIKSPVNENFEQSLADLAKNQAVYEKQVASYYKTSQRKARKNLAAAIENLEKNRKNTLDSLQQLSPVYEHIGQVYLTDLTTNEESFEAALKKSMDKKFETLSSAPDIPQLYNYFGQFAANLSEKDWTEKEKLDFLTKNINKLSKNNQAFAYNGAVNHLLRHDVILGMGLGKEFIAKFEDVRGKELNELRAAISRLESQTIGAQAPNLVGTAPDGSEINLKDLRGKYVLLDFWASWCGPCRRENPNVVRMYNQYKDKGFDILGISLDNKKENWKKAIDKDQLTWHHISDLKGWASEHAKIYGVRSVPHTVLIDPQGRIIATRLRAHTLEAKLEELFGS